MKLLPLWILLLGLGLAGSTRADVIALFNFEGDSFASIDTEPTATVSALADQATGTAALSESVTANNNRRFANEDLDGGGAGTATSRAIHYSMNRENPASTTAFTTYYQFTVTPTLGLNLSSFTADVAVNSSLAGTNTGAQYLLYSSLDGFTAALDGGAKVGPSLISATGDTAFQTLTWDLSPLATITSPVTFRFDPVATGATNGVNTQRGGAFDNLTLNATVVPEPGTLALLLLGAPLLTRLRRRA